MRADTAVVLIRPHTHGGVTHPPGSVLRLDAATAAWLVAQGTARMLDIKRGRGVRPTTEKE